MTLADLLLVHWRVAAEEVRTLVPTKLDVQTFDGSAWLGLAAFRATALRLRGTLPLPGLSSFPEVNVRTYVTAGGFPGIWFFSLDVASRLAVAPARRLYHLPYFHARMSLQRRGDWIEVESARTGMAGGPVVFSGRYRPGGPVFAAAPRSLEHFLAERYCLYSLDGRGGLGRAEIHHAAWPLQPAEVELGLHTMTPAGVALPDEPSLAHFAAERDVLIWPLRRVERL
jgi:uncharacterized protein YqjF (DUF2071 family)